MPDIESPAEVDDDPAARAGGHKISGIELDSRPSIDWLSEVEGEIDDVELVLKCLARDSATVCPTCTAAEHDGVLDQRPVLARCAGTKHPQLD